MPVDTFIATLAAIVALFSAGAAWLALLVARRNVADTIKAQIDIGARSSRANVVSANRQRWIDGLRDDVALFLATRRLYFNEDDELVGRAGSRENVMGQRPETYIKELEHLRIRIELRLNPNEDDHRELLQALNDLFVFYDSLGDAAVRELTQLICKAEWERLKKEAAGVDPFVRAVVEPAQKKVW